MNNIHTCSYSCDRPECIKSQRDELASAAEQEAVAWRDDVGNLYPDKESVDKYLPLGRTVHALYAAPVTAAPVGGRDVRSAIAGLEGSVAVGSDGEWVSVRRAARDAAVMALRNVSLDCAHIYAAYSEAKASTPAAPGIDLATAWAEGYRSGVTDERISESNIGIAGFGAKIEPARANPYMIDASPNGALNEQFGSAEGLDSPKGGSEAPQNGEVLVTVSGLTGSGKSAVAGEIEILCKALGLEVEWTNGDEEKYLTHADWTEALELYKPRVRIVEVNIPRVQAGDAEVQP